MSNLLDNAIDKYRDKIYPIYVLDTKLFPVVPVTREEFNYVPILVQEGVEVNVKIRVMLEECVVDSNYLVDKDYNDKLFGLCDIGN